MDWKLPAVPYGAPKSHGYWSPVTATLNWCEEDYYLTHYCAEIVNTVTNLMFLYLAYRGIRIWHELGQDFVFLVAWIGYAVLGTGSALFHGTLLYEMQMLDELGMIYTTSIMSYAMFSYEHSVATKWAIGVGIFLLNAFVTIYYYYLKDPTFHQVFFGVMIISVTAKTVHLCSTKVKPPRRVADQNGKVLVDGKRVPAEQQLAKDKIDVRAVIRLLRTILLSGTALFLIAFALWGVDIQFCSQLRSFRRRIGLPWGIIFELHGWWHILTGIGTYYLILGAIWTKHCLDGEHDIYQLEWPSWHSVPVIVEVPGKQSRTKSE